MVSVDHPIQKRPTTLESRCDNCEGKFEDISNRMDEFRDRLSINGWERTKAVWTVPQGFGNDTSVISDPGPLAIFTEL